MSLIRLRPLLLAVLTAPLSGCGAVLLDPAGDVAVQQRDVLLASTALMLLIILPVMALTALFAWRYRHSNTKAAYDPDWHHSTALEVAIWSAPLAIVIALGALAWVSTHLLDPYRPIGRLSPGRPVGAVKPLTVDVVALDWKWLFVYPDLGVATVNELAVPVDTPIDFNITSSHMMNSFFIPALAGQIYAMPGMQTPLHAVVNRVGEYRGFSSNYSGAGYSDMNFAVHGLRAGDFQRWVARVKAGGGALDRQGYLRLEKPSEREPVHEFAAVAPGLYQAVLNECVQPGKMCVADMMRIDAQGGRAPADTDARKSADTGAMVQNQHGDQGHVGPEAPQAPPSRSRPVQP